MSSAILTRAPTIKDGAKISALVRSTGLLEPNTTYAYLLLADHFGDTCAVAECEGEIVGCLLGYRLPREPSCLFFWQIGVSPAHQRRGIARSLLREIYERPQLQDVRSFEITVGVSNEASRTLFEAWSREIGAQMKDTGQMGPELFGAAGHEAETIFRIEPPRQ